MGNPPESLAGIELIRNDGQIIDTDGNPRLDIKNTQNRLLIRDITGRTIVEKENISPSGITLDLAGYPAGVYFVRVVAEDHQFIEKLVV